MRNIQKLSFLGTVVETPKQWTEQIVQKHLDGVENILYFIDPGGLITTLPDRDGDITFPFLKIGYAGDGEKLRKRLIASRKSVCGSLLLCDDDPPTVVQYRTIPSILHEVALHKFLKEYAPAFCVNKINYDYDITSTEAYYYVPSFIELIYRHLDQLMRAVILKSNPVEKVVVKDQLPDNVLKDFEKLNKWFQSFYPAESTPPPQKRMKLT